jgi:hypothetical protein
MKPEARRAIAHGALSLLLLPACGEKVGMRGLSTRYGLAERPLTPTLSP